MRIWGGAEKDFGYVLVLQRKQWMPHAAVHFDRFVEYPLGGDVASPNVRNAQAQMRGAVSDAADGLVSNHGFHTQADFASSSFAEQL